MKKMYSLKQKLLLVLAFTVAPAGVWLDACTRVVYKGPDNNIITARSMDWKDEIDANIWVFPRGMQRDGNVGSNSVKWTSKYGSVITSAWDIATTDGINEKGLVANVLWLVESQYPKFNPKGKAKGVTIAAWAQYVLDNFATVQETVAELKKEKFVIVSDFIPGTQKFTTLHLSISDASGDNAIFEYINGKLVIHHDPSYTVMTNSPEFDKQLAINQYWKGIPGTIMLPGTNRAADRFARASYYINAIPQTTDPHISVASVFSVIRNCSVPFGISSETEPNISSTRWRSVADHKNLVYYFETAKTPNVFWVDLKKTDFSKNAPAKRLSVSKNEVYAGETSNLFVPTKPFTFIGI
ncbi:linear amide C-N hydrolase [Elizabethkingia meningoseptica]|uniref:linear amide C-N hydrolase n=1 Tax=Elizabethkingia meningoseptica TaxID=238 RepID=UPI0023B0CCA9|nr:linear amide C-N hydrolase [Elizabethkingia meningoseptica]MDE5437306.1 linear amide C-N hydrolase [Elizabethkingia meningoseptica]MDE5510408.1 linear amide C-N hydrolase [Elizabethkingia meningoseptica]MDE5514185.1 linear amide C-N hydrolase [Elizabethkingia meningoseptica]MDE5524832.1 linear amide C-N hydrolase [Elizabethkingia meningoseptica]MDE5528396.1 linear amide C-N hydrolase [Elizabethkingia meningoseptica]